MTSRISTAFSTDWKRMGNGVLVGSCAFDWKMWMRRMVTAKRMYVVLYHLREHS